MMANWAEILATFILVGFAMFGFNYWLLLLIRKFRVMPVKEKIAYTTRLLSNLVPLVILFKKEAYEKFGPDEDAVDNDLLKRSYIMNKLYERIPDEYKKYVSVDNLDSIINEADRRIL